MKEKDSLRKAIFMMLKSMIEGGELKENVFTTSPNEYNVKMGNLNNIERVYPEYDEQNKEFANPKKVSEKTY
jgi:hypothetical protein